MRQFVSIFVVTSVACLLGLSLKKADYNLKTLYQEFMTPQKWRRVEIVDEKSMLEELISNYIWEYLEVLFVGLTACIFTLTIGWSAANSMRRGSADSGDEDIPEECLEEQDGFGRFEEVEEIITEIDLEQCGYRLSTRKSSNIELKLSESETMKKTCRSDCNGNGSCQENEEDTIKSVNRPTIEEENGKPATCKSETKAETCDNLITTEIFDKSGLYCRPTRIVEYVNLFKESTKSHNRDSHEMLSDEGKFNHPKVKIPQHPHKKVTKVDDLGGCKYRNEKSDHTQRGQVQKAEVEMNFNESGSTRMDTLEALRNEHGDSHLNSFRSTKTENVLEERTVNKLEVNRKINKVGDTNREMDSKNRERFSTKTTEGRVEVERFSKSDVPANTVTVVVDGTGPGRDSAGSAHWSDSSHRIDSSGRTPQYQNLNKEIKSKTTKLNKKDNRTVRAPTAPHKYIDELSRDVLSTQQSNSERPSTTASGDTLRATGSQRRKKNQKYHAQNSSNKIDSKNC